MKVSIIGAGRVGTALSLVLVARHLVDELVLVGRRAEVAQAEALDLLHATAFGRPTKVRAGGVEATAGSNIIVVCVGVRPVGENRSIGAAQTYQVLQSLIPDLASASPDTILLIATNPLDAMTTLAGRLCPFPPERVIGTGTLLDTMRLRSILSERIGIHPADIRAYVLGEHGDSQFAAFSSASAGGGRIDLPRDELLSIEAAARQMGHQIVRGKGYTNHAIALAAAEIIEAVVRDSREVMPLSLKVDGFAGVEDVCLSLPVVVGRGGVLRKITVELDEAETAAFVRSADAVNEQIRAILGFAGDGSRVGF